MDINRLDDGPAQEAHGFGSPKCADPASGVSVRRAAQGRHRLGMSTPAFVVELLKMARSRPVTRPQVQREMGIAEDTAYLWVAELVASGLLVEQSSKSASGRRGKPASAYALSPEWGGKP